MFIGDFYVLKTFIKHPLVGAGSFVSLCSLHLWLSSGFLSLQRLSPCSRSPKLNATAASLGTIDKPKGETPISVLACQNQRAAKLIWETPETEIKLKYTSPNQIPPIQAHSSLTFNLAAELSPACGMERTPCNVGGERKLASLKDTGCLEVAKSGPNGHKMMSGLVCGLCCSIY